MRRKALLVGLDDYPGTGNDLGSCLNDISAWRSILMDSYGFLREDIRMLADSRATKAAVQERLAWLSNDCQAGDVLAFIYSGHGTTFTERANSGVTDEAKDQALCLYGDIDVQNFLIDDELNSFCSSVSSDVSLVIICDSCFSGGMYKSLHNSNGSLDKYKYLPLPIDLAHRNDPATPTRRFGLGLDRNEAVKAAVTHDRTLAKNVLLAACRSIEPAAANRPDTNGLSVFTHYAINVLRHLTTPLTIREFMQLTVQQVANAGHIQIPQLYGTESFLNNHMLNP